METDLNSSLQQYKEQLRQVDDALKMTTDAEERSALTSLKNDLQELVDLTLQTINAQNDEESTETTETTEPSDPPIIDREMALFMEEIKKLDSTATEAEHCDNDELFQDKLKQIQDELQAMIGKKCSAPHNHAWGTKSYHNAMICGVDDSNEYALANIKDFKLRVLFINPTHQEMVPCSYYLEGECRFDSDKCRFSHGELVPFGELKEYEEPDFTKLLRNCVVLAKLPDRIWHKGRVLCSNFIEKTCRVRLDVQKKEVDCDFENLFPIFHDEDLSSGSSSDSDTDSDETDEETIMRNARLIQQSLFTPAPDRALGEWEKYTKGIGSKLMQKMGYIVGTGLGSNGEGIIVPISAQILPPGRSLDHCMELREAANGDQDLFNVERTMAKEQKKQEALSAKIYERESNRTDIFSFLNETISTNPQLTTENHKKKSINDFKSHSTKNLNVQSVQIADEIRKKEKEIVKLKEAVNRHPSTSEIHKKLQGQLSVKNQELNGLKSCESSLAKEQSLRKHKDKLSVF